MRDIKADIRNMYTKQDVKTARKELRISRNGRSKKVRETILVRVDKVWHKAIKHYALDNGITMSRAVDEACVALMGSEKYREYEKDNSK